MFKFSFVLIALIAACTAAEACHIAAPVPVVTATSSKVIARNYNGIRAAPIAAAAPVAPLVTRFCAAAQLTAPHYVAPFAAALLFW